MGKALKVSVAGLRALRLCADERQRMRTTAEVPPAAIDVERFRGRELVDSQECERDGGAEGRRPGAARDDADLPIVFEDAVAMDRRLIPVHEDAGEFPAYLADIRAASDDFLADIAAFGEAQSGVRRHFKCEGALVHFGPVPWNSRLDSQDLVGIPSDRSRAGS